MSLKERRDRALQSIEGDLTGWRPLPVAIEDEPLTPERLGRRAPEGAGTGAALWHGRYTEWADALDWLLSASSGGASNAPTHVVVGFGGRQVFADVVVSDRVGRALSGESRDTELVGRTLHVLREAAKENLPARLWCDVLEHGLSTEKAVRAADPNKTGEPKDLRRTFNRWAWRGGLGAPDDYPTRRADQLRVLLRLLDRSLVQTQDDGRPVADELKENAPLPAALSTNRVGAFVGRSSELALLRREWEMVRNGASRIVFAHGEGGIGKSELAYEFASSIQGEGIVLASRPSMAGTRAHAELAELIRQLDNLSLRRGPSDTMDEGELRALRLVVPDRFGAEQPGEARNPVGDRIALHDSLARLVRQAASTSSVLIVIEDLHASTRDSVSVIGDLIERRIPRTLIMVTARMNEPGSRRVRRLEEIAAQTGGSRAINLKLLTAGDVETLVRGVVMDLEPASEQPGLGAALYRRTRGHPFALKTLLETMTSTGTTRLTGSPERAAVPDAIADHMARRIERLPADEQTVIRTAAVIGDEFDADLLARTLCRTLDPDLIRSLEALDEVGLLVGIDERPDHVRFEHQLARDAVYKQLSPLTRAQVHANVADALRTNYKADDVATYAHHCYEAARGLVDRRPHSVEASIDAGRDSVVRLAYEDAVDHFQQAVEHAPKAGSRILAVASAALGDALWRLGRLPEARTVLEDAASIAQSLGEVELLAELATSLSMVAFQSNASDPQLLELYEQALRMLPPGETYWRLRLMTAISRELPLRRRATRLPELALEAIALDTEEGNPSSHAYSLLIQHDALLGEDNAQRAALATQLVQAADEARDPFLAFVGHGQQLYAALETLDLAWARDAIASCDDVGRRYRFRYAAWHAALYRASLALVQLPLDEAEALMTEAREVGEPLGYEEVRLMHGVQMAYLLRERGRGEEAGDIVREGARQYDLPVWQAALANGLCEIQGGTLVANAREVLGRLEAAGLDALPRDGTYPLALTFLATTYAYLRDRRGARRLLPVIQACRNRHPVIAGNATYWGSMNYHIGLVQATVGNHTAAIDSFHLAYEDNERVQSPLWRAFTLVAHAQTLRVHDSRGAEKGATQCLDEASSIAARYGYGRVQKHIDGTGPTLVSAEPLSP